MRVIHGNGSKPALKEMVGPAPASVDAIGVAPMRLTNCTPQRVRFARNQDEVHMVGHEAIRPDLNASFEALLGQQIAIEFVIAILEKDRLAPIPALRDMVRKIRNHNAG